MTAFFADDDDRGASSIEDAEAAGWRFGKDAEAIGVTWNVDEGDDE